METDYHKLSKNARRLFKVLYLPWLAYALYSTFGDRGLAAWLNDYQAAHNYGTFYPVITAGLVFLCPLSIAVSISRLYDRLSRQGVYAKKA